MAQIFASTPYETLTSTAFSIESAKFIISQYKANPDVTMIWGRGVNGDVVIWER